MPTITVQFSSAFSATFHRLQGLDAALYRFGDETIHVHSSYFGQPSRYAVTISLGTPPDESGYGLTGLTVNGHHLTGVVRCIGLDLAPFAHPSPYGRFPLDGLDDTTAGMARALLTDLAQHFYDAIN